ncbi:MAG: hypothetical protein H7287_08185 [Thermoleophilia bacterium]|nr:hypothetical protein [Thermoleophilia bacterium]
MNSNRLASAHIVPTTELAAHTAPITGWHAFQGLPIGYFPGMSPGTDLEITVDQVFEETTDLAVADRVAYVLASRSGVNHVVLTTATGFVVATLGHELDWAASMRLVGYEHMPRIVSVAGAEGVMPVLVAA